MRLLDVEGIVGGYASAEHIVKGVALSADTDEVVTIIGPNGAGKSTALKLISGLLSPSQGRVLIGGEDITGQSPQAIAKAGLGFVPQERNVFGSLTIAENLEVSCLFERSAAKKRMEEAYARFPMLFDKRRISAKSLSGGQRQILAMAMALMGKPRALLLDEPTAGLSPKAAHELFEYIRSIAKEGIAILMVEQNALESLEVSDRAYVLVDGRNHLDGPAETVANDPDIRRLFLGGRATKPTGVGQQANPPRH
ncbi:ABC transporter ATP-binding protein [Microvirga sp. 3-52]|jgi:branched-chain amino acid transport system ATP-binding protein|uniref:ABC transporter ATP-binding protein n=1 Tax=Microvirga sp. 3-52 TaxID=2792425 RepID=UPI001AC64C05|nr:ABC transporter ATP-binding protein [Microvirga sp. 3-52]MBO1908603.1 ABC transporter ATP-binding protein [Microvirga sp. 3-52]MBS7455060.1 ABC transporter ATP-binding protein [Microvirga sp. 3-52]